MTDRPVPLQLAEAIRTLFEQSGATQMEQSAALAITRELIPFTGNSAIEAAEGASPDPRSYAPLAPE